MNNILTILISMGGMFLMYRSLRSLTARI